jgi:hypothetical protein
MVSTIRYRWFIGYRNGPSTDFTPTKTMTFHSERNFPEALSRRANGEEFLEICCPEVLERSISGGFFVLLRSGLRWVVQPVGLR